MHCNEFTKQVFPKFIKPTAAILQARHEVKHCVKSSKFTNYNPRLKLVFLAA